MADFANWELTTGRAHVDDWPEVLQRMAEARASVAAVLTTDPAAIALTHSTTDGMNAIAAAIDWRPGDRAVTTCLEHAGAVGPLYALRARGIEIDFVDIGDGGDDARTFAAVEAAMTPQTRLVVASHVTWLTGAVLPVAALADIAHAGGALMAVDGAQSVGAIRVDFEATGADAYAVAAQKWLLGPEGMGALAVRPELATRLHPAFAGYLSFATIDSVGTAVFQPDARRFEWGTFHRPSIIGMARSISWMSMYVGLDWIYARGAATARRAADRLATIPGVQVLTPTHQMATLVTFRIEGWPAATALAELGARAFAIARTVDVLDAIRISVGVLHLRRRGRAVRRGGRPAGRPYARDDPAPSDADDARWLTCRRSASARGRRSAGASSGTRRDPSSGPWRPAWAWRSGSRSPISPMTWP